MSGSGAFRHKPFPGPKANTMSLPRLRTLSGIKFPVHEFSPGPAQGQGPQLRLGRQGVQSRERDSGKWRGGKSRASLGDSLWFTQNSSSQSVVCGTLEVMETISHNDHVQKFWGFFPHFWPPCGTWSSQARDQIWAIAETYASAAATLDP